MNFKVGDEVIIQNADRKYIITTDGSYGVVANVDNISLLVVSFKHVTGLSRTFKPWKEFEIQPEYLRHLTKLEKLLLGIDNEV
jgi:hypothetical protein